MTSFSLQQADLKSLHQSLQQEQQALLAKKLNLDLTRGKPSSEQLSLSDALDGILTGQYQAQDGSDTRNYGGLDGLPECKALVAPLMGVDASEVLIGGNSSLTLMYQTIQFYYLFGINGGKAWQQEGTVKFLCPVPGYDRHFAICQAFGIEMINVPMDDNGPDMDLVESLIKNDSSIKGIWCVPRFSNPSGIVYSDDTVKRLAKLGQIASNNFRVFYDNAYNIHAFEENAPELSNIMHYAKEYGTLDSILQFGSTSKVTFAGAGISWMSSSKANLQGFAKHLGIASIGPDKINQLRHIEFFTRHTSFSEHMQKHAALLKPRFDSVLNKLDQHFANHEVLQWTVPQGGYFVSVDTLPGLAQRVVQLANEMGVKLTPAGATFPYQKDPDNRNIRLAPSYPSLADIDQAMDVFVLAVKLASVEKALA